MQLRLDPRAEHALDLQVARHQGVVCNSGPCSHLYRTQYISRATGVKRAPETRRDSGETYGNAVSSVGFAGVTSRSRQYPGACIALVRGPGGHIAIDGVPGFFDSRYRPRARDTGRRPAGHPRRSPACTRAWAARAWPQCQPTRGPKPTRCDSRAGRGAKTLAPNETWPSARA